MEDEIMKEYAVDLKSYSTDIEFIVYKAIDGDYLNREIITLRPKYRIIRKYKYKTHEVIKSARRQLDELVEQLKSEGYEEIPYSKFDKLWWNQYYPILNAKVRAEFEARKAVER